MRWPANEQRTRSSAAKSAATRFLADRVIVSALATLNCVSDRDQFAVVFLGPGNAARFVSVGRVDWQLGSRAATRADSVWKMWLIHGRNYITAGHSYD